MNLTFKDYTAQIKKKSLISLIYTIEVYANIYAVRVSGKFLQGINNYTYTLNCYIYTQVDGFKTIS